ncbi:hypothetical protein [Catenisphaera adipataccumulans]|jgi:hypothetical protein|uniref:Uncharacterized protein n=1 Tax=Catenisphaera adipataccumulans TaxID=700500 RepID=A0A7W8CXV1_9FIRM|nr:hypothetical protein [Catenisphaera adipataccumulans]MBB5183576.1 hypothetical protein [Catenisphaera adipataccumulans]
MKRNFGALHVYLINPLLNAAAFFYLDIFYDNFTYMEFTLHHYFFVLAWTLSTVFGFFFYPLAAWDRLHIPYKRWFHAAACALLAVSGLIPYGAQYPSFSSTMHVTVIELGLLFLCIEWLVKLKYLPIPVLLHGLVLLSICFLSVMYCGHVAALTEIIVSVLFNIALYRWQAQKK